MEIENNYLGSQGILGSNADCDEKIYVTMYETTSLAWVTSITLEMRGICKTKGKGTVHRHCPIVDNDTNTHGKGKGFRLIILIQLYLCTGNE